MMHAEYMKTPHVAIQAVPYRPDRSGSQGASNVMGIRQFILRQCIKVVTCHRLVSFEALCHGRQRSQTGRESAHPRKGWMLPPEFAQDCFKKALSCGPVYDKKSFKALFTEGVTHSIRKTLRRWWVTHQYVSLEHLAQRA